MLLLETCAEATEDLSMTFQSVIQTLGIGGDRKKVKMTM